MGELFASSSAFDCVSSFLLPIALGESLHCPGPCSLTQSLQHSLRNMVSSDITRQGEQQRALCFLRAYSCAVQLPVHPLITKGEVISMFAHSAFLCAALDAAGYA